MKTKTDKYFDNLNTVEKETVLIELALTQLLGRKKARIRQLDALNKTYKTKEYYLDESFYENISIIEKLLKDFKPQRSINSIPYRSSYTKSKV